MKKIALICLLAFSLFAIEVPLYIGSVSRPLEQDWHLTKGDILMEQVAWPNGESGLTAKFTYLPNPEGWPSAKFFIPEGMRDWRTATKLSIEVYCTVSGIVGLEVATYNDVKRMAWYNLSYPVGRHTIEVDLNSMKDWDTSNVKYIDIHASKPTKSYSLYVGDIRLEVSDPEVEAAECRAAAAAERKALAWRIKAFGDKVPPKAKVLRQRGERLPKNPSRDEVEEFQQACRSAYPALDKMIFQNHVQDGLAVLWCLPEEKVIRDTDVYAFLAEPTTEYALEVARGEAESAQLVAYAPEGLSRVRAELVGAPVNDQGVALPLEALKLCPVGYVKTTAPNYKVEYIGYWPDPILEYLDTPVAIEKERYQSWWLDVRVPETQTPGIYRGQVRFVTENGERLMPYSVQVWNFKLPAGVPYMSPVQYSLPDAFPKGQEARDAYYRALAKMLIDHRLEPDAIYESVARQNLVPTALQNLGNGSFAFNMGLIYKEVDDKFYKEIADAYRRVKEAGLEDKAFIYCFDEAPASAFPMIREALLRVREAAPGIPVYTTLYDNSFGIASNLDDVVDGWIPLTTVYGQNEKAIAEARARGKKVGWYVCCTPWAPYANFLLEYPAVGARLLMGYMNKKFKPDHFLYYQSCVWREWEVKNGEYIQKSMIGEPLAGGPLFEYPWIGESFRNFSGDGRLMYPAADGPIPTQRLKCIRDGMEDWLYMDLLEKCLSNSNMMDDTWKENATQELTVEDAMVTTLTKWTKDPTIVHEKSARIAKLLEEYFAKQ